MHTITEIDMHLRDQRVFAWMRERVAKNGGRPVRIRHQEIAEEFLCHKNTARAIVTRLVRAELVEVVSCGKPGGYFYQVKRESAA